MKLIIHDLPEDMAKTLFSHHSSDYKIISGCADITPCMGCFGCWSLVTLYMITST